MFELVVILICLGANAVLSSIEMAFVTVSKPHLKKLASQGGVRAQRVLNLKDNPERTLSVLQIGITLVGAISAAVGGAGAEENLSPLLIQNLGLTEELAEGVSIVLVVIPLTYFSVVIGELVPKSFALKFPMKIALSGGALLILLDRLFSPFVWVLEFSTRILMKVLSKEPSAGTYAEGNTSVDLEPLSDLNRQYVLNLVNVDRRTVADILVPWEEVSTVDISDHFRVVVQKIKNSKRTRLPVIEEGKVVGLLHAKEFTYESDISRIDWTELVRPIIKLSPNVPILTALKFLQSKSSHMSLIVKDDEPLGIVTIEDIFEEVVGDISDEDETPRTLLSANSRIRTMSGLGPKK